MIRHLDIRNLALIDRMNLDFHPGLNVITGETGAGKSIMLNGLAMVLGKRADTSLMRHRDRKLVVETEFDISRTDLKDFFAHEDLDYDDHSIIRREITPAGKSRAFVNDTPVRLDVLENLGRRLVDIHSQNQNHLLRDKTFRLRLIDLWAGNEDLLNEYGRLYAQWKEHEATLRRLEADYERMKESEDYRLFQLEELQALDWDLDLTEAEQRLRQYESRERLLENLAHLQRLTDDDTMGLTAQWTEARGRLEQAAESEPRLQDILEQWDTLFEQWQESLGDIDRIADEYRWMNDAEAAELREKLDAYFRLMTKHQVADQAELKALKERWEAETNRLDEIRAQRDALRKQTAGEVKQIRALAERLRERRRSQIPGLVKAVEEHLRQLGMEHSRLKIELEPTEPGPYGADHPVFLLSSDKGRSWGEVRKQASGGELSRLMLTFKLLMSRKTQWPTLVFDEIDAGVSGDVARKMAAMIRELSRSAQVILITHLPQMAVAADRHFKVYKHEAAGDVVSEIKELSQAERVHEIAEMIEGKPPSESALRHAAHLLETAKTGAE